MKLAQDAYFIDIPNENQSWNEIGGNLKSNKDAYFIDIPNENQSWNEKWQNCIFH